ncbi:MAG TPA: DNA repair protein RecO [Gaiellaceae bacterium]|nr:DNA repair protein RecO [Gaiellaceae bacterium]
MPGRSLKTEAVVLRSLRFGEADRILHVYTLAQGRMGVIAKGARKTKSRFGGRLEPLSHVELILHVGSGELATLTGADLVRSHAAAREEPYRLSVGLIGAEAMLRLFPEQERSDRAFTALTRFLELLDDLPARDTRPELDPLGLSFQLKLLWVAGYLPHLGSCAECGADGPFIGFSARAGGVVCRECAPSSAAIVLTPDGAAGLEGLLRQPLADAVGVPVSPRGARDILAVVTASYEYHGGFRLRTLSA